MEWSDGPHPPRPVQIVEGAVEAAALHEGAGEEAGAVRRHQVVHDGEGAGALAEQGHPVAVAAKGRDILLHPAQSWKARQ